MEIIFAPLKMAAEQLSPYLSEISMAIVATILAIYGDFINKKVKKLIKDKPFILRSASFILICAFGYGFMTLFFAKFLSSVFRQIPQQYFVLSVIGCFVLLGVLAEKKNQI